MGDRGGSDGPELTGVETGTRTVYPGQKGHRRAASEERGTSDSENEGFCTIYSHNEPYSAIMLDRDALCNWLASLKKNLSSPNGMEFPKWVLEDHLMVELVF